MKFEIYKDIAGKFRFRAKSRNGKIIAVGEAYNSKQSCLGGIRALINCKTAKIVDLTKEI